MLEILLPERSQEDYNEVVVSAVVNLQLIKEIRLDNSDSAYDYPGLTGNILRVPE